MVGRSIVGEEGWNIVEYTLIRLPWHHRIPNRWRRNAERSQVWPNMYRIWTEGNERDRIKIHHNEGKTVDEKKEEDVGWKIKCGGSEWLDGSSADEEELMSAMEANRIKFNSDWKWSLSHEWQDTTKKSQGKSKGPPGKGSISTWMLELKKKREWAQTGRYDPWSVSASNLIRVSIHLGKGDDFQMFASLAR